MSVAVLLVLAQASLTPSGGAATFPVAGTWRPIPSGTVSATFDDGGWVVASADNRRFAGSGVLTDVWLTTLGDAGILRAEGSPLFVSANRQSPRLASNASGRALAWTESNVTAGLLKVRFSMGHSFPGLWLPESLLASGVIGGTPAVAGAGGEWRAAWRAPSATLVDFFPMTAQYTFGQPPALSLTALSGGGFLLAGPIPNSIVTTPVGLPNAAVQTSMLPGVLRLSSSAQAPHLVAQNDAGVLSFATFTGTALVVSPFTVEASPATAPLSAAFLDGTLVSYRLPDAGTVLQFVGRTDAGALATYTTPTTTEAVVLTSAPAHDRALLVERGLSGLTVRQVSTFVGAPVPLLASVPLDVLPRPQLKPTVAWSSVRQAFLVMWEGVDAPGRAQTMYAYLQLDGGLLTSPQGLGVSVNGGTRPRLVATRSGALELLSVNGGAVTVNGLSEGSPLSTVSVLSVPAGTAFAERGEASLLAWRSLDAGSTEFLIGNTPVIVVPQPMLRCAAWKAGRYWFGSATTDQHISVLEDGGSLDVRMVPLAGQGPACFATVGDTVVVAFRSSAGIRLVSVDPPGGDVMQPVPVSADALVTPLGDRALVSWIDGNGVKGVVVDLDGGTVPLQLDLAPAAIDQKELWAAGAPVGAAAVVWQSFDVPTGRLLISARIVSAAAADSGVALDGGGDAGMSDGGSVAPDDAGMSDGGSVAPDDAGVADGGSVAPDDAGVADGGSVAPDDAGVADGGSVMPADAGEPDAGAVGLDAGSPDAGGRDAGAVDAGPQVLNALVFVPACGCDGTAGAPLLFLALVLMVRRRPAR